MFFSEEDLLNNKFNCYYSKIFDLPKFRTEKYRHLGLLIPAKSKYGYLEELAVVLGQGELYDEYSQFGVNYLFSQTTTKKLIEEIKEMLINKYGIPLKSELLTDNKLIKYEKNKFNVFRGKGVTNTWETSMYRIIMFEGIQNNEMLFGSCGYLFADEYENLKECDHDYNTQSCQSYAFINYKLKDDVIEKMNIDEIKL